MVILILQPRSWLGGVETVANSPVRVPALTMEAFYRIPLNEYRDGSRQAEAHVFVALIAAACLLACVAGRRRVWAGSAKVPPSGLAAMGIFIVPYVIGIFAASLTTNATDFLRYFLLVYPVRLAGLAAVSPVFESPRYAWV